MKNSLFYIVLAAALVGGCQNRLLQEANQHYSNYEYSLAASQYENFLERDSAHKDASMAMLRLADCYREMNRHHQAVKWYAKSIEVPEATAEDKLHYAQELWAVGNNAEAKKWYDAYLGYMPDDSVAINQRASLDMEVISDPFYDVTAVPVACNSSCFSPMLYNDKLYYASEAHKEPGVPVNQWTGNGYLDIYVGDPDNLMNATEIDSNVINSNLHESNIVFADNGNTAFFTRSSIKETKNRRKTTHDVASAADRTNHVEIAKAELVDGQWANVTPLSFNNPEFSSGHPSLNASGTRMFFTSDRPGGFGGTDLYYSDLVDGSWSAPQNAGPNVNTAGDEMFPAMRVSSAAEFMYFSSDGFMGCGGLDIFRSELVNGMPTKAQRLPAPFNSLGDDFGITFADDAKSGYFSSNRGSETGEDRIYKFVRKNPNFFVDLTVLDKETSMPVPNTEVEITNINTMAVWSNKTDASGHILFPADSLTSYGFRLTCDEYFCGFSSASTPAYRGNFYDTTYAIAELDKIVIDKAIRLENIYYDYNKWNIRADAAGELDKLVKLLSDNPKIKIELSSHTDCRGSDKYNQTLSQKRAQSAVDYIVSKGISKDRITAKGYGEAKLLNKCDDGVKCTEEEHQWNRRTEFKVVEIQK